MGDEEPASGPLLAIAPLPEKPKTHTHAAVLAPPNELLLATRKGDADAVARCLQTADGRGMIGETNYEGNTPVLIARFSFLERLMRL